MEIVVEPIIPGASQERVAQANGTMALIRAATEEDMRAVTEIYAHHVLHGTATFEIDPPDLAEMDKRRLEILDHGLPYLVAKVEGAVAGYAYAGLYRTRAAYRFTVEDSIYIHPGFVARGLGKLLLARLLESCQARGSRQMIAVIGDSLNIASIRLHERFGFRKVGVFEAVGRKFGRWLDTVLMQRALCANGRVSALRELVERSNERANVLMDVAQFLRQSGKHRWVGLYEVDHGAGEVRNLVFSGPGAPAHPRFGIDQGLTSMCVRERRTVNVGDVAADSRYLTALGTTRSEIIVPIFDGERARVIGTIDIESEDLQAFSDEDQIFLEDCAGMIGTLWSLHA
jgi:L-amino acid N-acyltransferase YncA/putative methionine-R-sulfoxide reductase with GAF domain